MPDLKQAQTFYADFGLDVREEGNGLGLYTVGHDHRWGRVGEGPAKKLTYVSFGAYPEDFEGLRARLKQFGVRQLDPPHGFESNGVWFRDPDGTLVEIRVAEKSSPNEKAVQSNPSSPPGVQGSHAALQGAVRAAAAPGPRADVQQRRQPLDRLLHRVVGLRLSDRSGDGVAFMHGIHGSDHHMIAFAKSGGPGLHHLSWDVGSFHEVGLGAMQMADRGFTAGWGVGRHVLGSNYFHYVRDPWGSYAEYSSDIDYIPVDYDWEAGDHPGHDAFYVWGPNPPADFVTNYETAAESRDGGNVDVLIAGAGPVGLSLAIELGHRGVRCLVVERNDRVGYSPRAKTTNVRSREHLRRWGIADALRQASPIPPDYPPDVVFATRMNGHALARFENAFNGRRVRNELYSEEAQWVPQYTLEEVLRAHATRLPGVTVRSTPS